MSHFSKIKTNISNLSILKQTLQDLGFYFELVSHSISDNKSQNICEPTDLVIYSCSLYKNPLFRFVWNVSEYNLIVDLQLWSLDMDINYFIDKLSQKYAYNMILNQSVSSGFQKIHEKISNDGSVKVTLQKWSS